ncbi:MAG: ABC transporter ATP-binding protein [Bdellovibrio sp.]
MNSVEISQLQFSYSSGPTVLDIKYFSIKSGEKIFIYGPSGTGKSTLLNLLSGVLSPRTGSLKILDQDITKISQGGRDTFRGKNIGYIFQSFNLIPYLSVEENILLGKHFRGAPNDIKNRCHHLARDLNIFEHLSKKASQLSLGQQQRVACARALIEKPSIVIADEPTSSLDQKNTDEFMELLIKEWNELKFTLIFVSHDMDLAKYFDRKVALSEINRGGEHD